MSWKIKDIKFQVFLDKKLEPTKDPKRADVFGAYDEALQALENWQNKPIDILRKNQFSFKITE